MGVAQAASPFQETATPTSLPYANSASWYLPASACGSTDCAAVGSYDDSTGHQEPLVVPSASGTPSAGVKVQLPSGTNTANPSSELYDVSCWSSGSCVAVGYYRDTSMNIQPVVVPITNGSVGTGIAVALPSGAITTSNTQDARLNAVSCSSTGACVAVGYYKDTSYNYQALVVPISNGTVGSSAEAPLPSGAVTTGQDTSLESVSCTASGSCVAVGYYRPSPSAYLPFTESVSGGTPTNPMPVAVPSNAYTGGDTASLEHVSCWAVGSCAAVGYYDDSSDYEQELATPIVNGVPQQGVEVTLPSGADPSVDNPALDGLACQPSGDCLAVGYYYDHTDNYFAMVAPITNGAVGAGTNISLPSNTASQGVGSALYDVGCPPSGSCLAAGYYEDNAGHTEGLTLPFSGGAVGSGIEGPAPTDESKTSPYAYFQAVGCGASGSCVVPGDELNQAGAYAPYVLSAQAPLTIATSTLPGVGVGLPYQQSLSATGAWGSYTWSLVAGNLLPGLSLNLSTGVISGTPSASGTAKFSVTATGTGSPAQTATQPLSLTAAAAQLRVTTKSAIVRKNRAGLRFACSVGSCSGVAKLEITKTATVKHGKKHVKKRVTVVIGSTSFSIAVGSARSLTVALNGSGRRALASHSPLSVTLVATVSGVKETVGHVTLKAAPTSKKKKH